MRKEKKHFWQAVAVMVGYIIGVGMFGLPFLVSKAGLVSFFVLLIILGFVQHFIHLIYANVILETRSRHRMPGYAEKYLGRPWKEITFLAKMIGNFGALLAYIIITGVFLNQLLGPYLGGSEFIYANILFFIEAGIVLLGVGMIARAELIMATFLLAVVVLVSIKSLGHIEIGNYNLFNWKYIILPYGAMLMALDGNGSLPMVVRILKRDKELIKKAIRLGTFIPIVVIAIFTLAIVGLAGENTTADALTGISSVLGSGTVKIALVFGIITMVTSFLGVAESVKETLWWDYEVNKLLAWALAVFVPYLLYIANFRNFIEVISFAGAIAGGMSAVILILIFLQMKKKKKQLILFKKQPNIIILSLLIGLFVAGIIYKIWAFSVL